MTSTHGDALDGRHATTPSERLAALVAEAGMDAEPDDALVTALADLASLGAGDPPVPSPELAALLEASDRAANVSARRRPRSRRARIAIVTLTAAACLSGVGMAAAATTNEGLRHSIGHTVAVFVGAVTGTGRGVPAPVGGASGTPAPEASRLIVRPTAPGSGLWRAVPSGPHGTSPAGVETGPSRPGIIAQPTQDPMAAAPGRPATLPPTTARPTGPGSG